MKTSLLNHDLIDAPLVVMPTNRSLVLQSTEFTGYLNGFEQWLRVLGYAGSTVYYFPSYVRTFMHFLENNGIQKLSKVRSTHIRSFLSDLSQKKNSNTGNPLSKNYLLNHLNAIKRFSRFLADSHNITFDCCAKITRGFPIIRRWLSLAEIKSLYDSCQDTSEGSMDRAILSVYYGLGLRRSEGIALEIGDIFNTNGNVYVRNGKFKKERYVPMTGSVFSDIKRYVIKARTIRTKQNNHRNDQALFISERGQRITGNAIYERLQRLAKNAGIRTPLPLHSLRHSIATHLLEAGMSLENISRFLGHSSLESTQIYTHLLHNFSSNDQLF